MSNNYFSLLAEDIKKMWNMLDGTQKFGMAFLIVATLIASTFFLTKSFEPNWTVLYSDLAETDTLSIVENMKKNGFAYKVSADKKSILVPSNAVDEMRLFVADNNLIQIENRGFELIDDYKMGSTEFQNKLTKQRIFQGELVRSIEKINGVKTARVQLAEPERSIFQDKDELPTASVMLILQPGYRIKSAQVKAIKNLVAYAIPRLTPDQVFVTDQNGVTLSDETSKNSNDMDSFKNNVESQTAQKVVTVLEKIVGKGNVSVQVNADIDFNTAKSTIESYTPINSKGEGVVTSSQTEIETYENPNGGQTPNEVKKLNYAKEKNAVNYSVSKEIKQIIYAPGTIKRLTIAVAINKILTEKEKEELKQLVLSAAGADFVRGDVITVSGLQFENLGQEIQKQASLEKEVKQNAIIDYLTTKVAPLIVILILGMTALKLLKNLVNKLPVRQVPVETKYIEKEEEEPEEGLVDEPVNPSTQEIIKDAEVMRQSQKIDELNNAILADPAEAAKLLTSYIKD
ncbi:flagellar M-ring protein FliF [bacterium]|nr:flagellar M-ring protein FliF [bacterium]